jgi:hypothetical protein
LTPALFEWIHFRCIRWKVFKKQAAKAGLLLEVLRYEIRRVVQDDYQLLSELFLECSQKVCGNLSSKRSFDKWMKRSPSSVTAPNRLIEAQPPEIGSLGREFTGNHPRFCLVLITCVF